MCGDGYGAVLGELGVWCAPGQRWPGVTGRARRVCVGGGRGEGLGDVWDYVCGVGLDDLVDGVVHGVDGELVYA